MGYTSTIHVVYATQVGSSEKLGKVKKFIRKFLKKNPKVKAEWKAAEYYMNNLDDIEAIIEYAESIENYTYLCDAEYVYICSFNHEHEAHPDEKSMNMTLPTEQENEKFAEWCKEYSLPEPTFMTIHVRR